MIGPWPAPRVRKETKLLVEGVRSRGRTARLVAPGVQPGRGRPWSRRTASYVPAMPGTSRVVNACRLGMFVQAMVINLAPLLFVQLRGEFSLSWEQVGRLVLINFLTQLAVDLAGGWLVGRLGLRVLCVGAHVLAALGLVVFASAAAGGGYAVLVAGTMVFSAGCGLLEVLLSPIINAVPSTRKAGDMALLHAFYPLGKLAVILGTAGALWLAGPGVWAWIVVGWAVLPCLGAWWFAVVDIPPLVEGPQRQRLRDLLRLASCRGVLLAMLLAGASELAIAQWTSAFAQRGLGCSQVVADLLGFALFAVGMAAGRLWYGLRGNGADLTAMLLLGATGSAVVYLVAALSPWPLLALAACSCAGFAVSMLWPCTLSLAAAWWPMGGATLFAALAAAGDGGAALGPWLIGVVADSATIAASAWSWLPGGYGVEANGLRAGLLVGALAPLLLVVVSCWLRRQTPHEKLS